MEDCYLTKWLLAIAGTAEDRITRAINRPAPLHSRLALGGAQGLRGDLNFCAMTGVRPMIEEFPLEDAARAYQRMITNQVRFRGAVVVSR
jgi:hypothetical protein